MQSFSNWVSRHHTATLFIIFVVFLIVRLPGVHAPYQQDEYKWVLYSHPDITAPGTVPHPPLTEFIYARTLGPLVGDNNFRTIPLAFSIADFFLLFYLVKIMFDRKTAYWSVVLFSISFYSVLASLMVDVDGAIMPFFMLIMAIGYYKLKQGDWHINSRGTFWLIVLLIGAIGGFFIKVSALLPMVALAIDFAIEKNIFSDKKKVFKYVLWIIGVAVLLVLLLIGSKFVFPYFNLKYSLGYWEHFADSSSFFNRGWMQTFIETSKALLYCSPLLLAPLCFTDKEIFKKARPLYIFIVLGFIFYVLAFDFSIGALDRYFEFLIVPLCIIAGAVYTKYISSYISTTSAGHTNNTNIFLIAFASICIFFSQFFPQSTPPLYPKTEWLHRLVSLRWNFLFPFDGGSGPLPFYVSFAFIGLFWIFTYVLVFTALYKKEARRSLLVGMCIVGVIYSGVFVEEYIYGMINGSAPALVTDTVSFIASHPEVQNVTVYNDNGGFNVQQTGKYLKRLYIDPSFSLKDKITTLNANKFYYMVVNIPFIDPQSVYQKYFNSCVVAYEKTDKYITGTIYDCRTAPNITQ